ncbi:unnamed protein product [Fraxinus pennsylvanica]|uniref:PARP catalytic domain-containing protein n=1 Tax=Fraxinus pennsylvanica TaxID=56036 RepID=A0AAD2AKD4_9LAMI|nr:unnamed protein product [Fraxinus pennsylvanica]
MLDVVGKSGTDYEIGTNTRDQRRRCKERIGATEDFDIQISVTDDDDDDGLRHMLLCRVILGRMEVVRPGSEQYNPSSEEFDSGIDNLVSPRKYIGWSTRMNTHILPEFVVSFRIPSNLRRNQRIQPHLIACFLH